MERWQDRTLEGIVLYRMRVRPVQSELLEYIGELRHDIEDPYEQMANYLGAHAKPGDTVLIEYGHYSLILITGMRVYSPSEYITEPLPDWVIRRQFTPVEFPLELRNKFASASYELVEIPDGKDWMWLQRPDPTFHIFQPKASESRPIIMLHLIGDEASE